MARLGIALAMFASALLIALAVPAWQVHAQMLSFRSAPPAADHPTTGGKTTRVRADLARRVESWQGTRACASARRARAALRPAVAQWLGRQAMAHPGKSLTQWGYHSGDLWVEDRTVDGARQCSAGFRKLIAYAQFR